MSVSRPKPGLPPEVRTLLSLPVELLSQIIDHLVPSDETFRIGSSHLQASSISKDLRSTLNLPPHPSTQHAWFANPGTTTSHRLLPASFLPFTWEWPVYSLLLTCSTLHELTVQRLYTTNTFSFADPDSAIRFSRQLYTRTRELIRFIHVDVCGGVVVQERLARPLRNYRPTSTQQIPYRRYTFDHGIDARIVDVPSHFPQLWELRVGGIGPGVVKREVYAGELDSREHRDEWHSTAVVALARLVGVEFDSTSPTTIPAPTAGSENTLKNGRIFLCRPPTEQDEDEDDEVWPHIIGQGLDLDEDGRSKSFGALQVHGTRIISSTLIPTAIIEDLVVGEDRRKSEINLHDLLDRSGLNDYRPAEERRKDEEWQEKREEILRRLEERKKRMMMMTTTGNKKRRTTSGSDTWDLGLGIGNVVGMVKKGWGLFV